MNILEFLNEVCDRGTRSVEDTYKKSDPRRAGGIEGFVIARKLLKPEDFIEAIAKSREAEIEYRGKHVDAISAKYRKQRYTTLQIEYVFDLMKVAWNNSTPRIYEFPTVSARAVQQYARIVGVKE